MNDEARIELNTLIQASTIVTTIRTIMFNKFKKFISDSTIRAARQYFMRGTLEEIGIDPHVTHHVTVF